MAVRPCILEVAFKSVCKSNRQRKAGTSFRPTLGG